MLFFFVAVASTCQYQADTDYDCTAGSSVHATSQEACCQACHTEVDCIAGVYQPSTAKCYLKGGVVVAKAKSGVMGCVARQPQPAPPFDCSAPDADCAGRLGATHWNPCYFVNSSVPSLIDGALAVSGMGSRVIKVALFSPKGNYPFNSPKWPDDAGFPTLLSMAQHQYYQQLWELPDIETYVLIAYSTVGGAAGGDISYWVQGISAAQRAEEEAQLHSCATWLLQRYAHLGKTFIFENWEGDWASRGGSYNPKVPATPLALASMRDWLEARQAGVSRARSEHEASSEDSIKPGIKPGTKLGIKPGTVWFSAEVNLIKDSRTEGLPNMVNRVLPFVATDLVSYSSYDTQADRSEFEAALHYLAAQQNRTAASPPGLRSVFVAEYGLPQNHVGTATLQALVKNVVNVALSLGVRHVLFWETYDNECTASVPGCSGGGDRGTPFFASHAFMASALNGPADTMSPTAWSPARRLGTGRCHDATHPVTDPSDLNGFWLVRPDGSKAWPYIFLAGLIANRSQALGA